MDPSPSVQHYACNAVAEVAEQTMEQMAPYTLFICQHFAQVMRVVIGVSLRFEKKVECLDKSSKYRTEVKPQGCDWGLTLV